MYACFWISPRGFANEGTYTYGTLADCRKLVEHASDSATYTRISSHRTMEAAKTRAEKEVRKSRARIAWGEQDYTSAESATSVLNEQ